MNLCRAAIPPFNICTSFTIFGVFMLITAYTFSRCGFIPSLITMYPKKIPLVTPNAYFSAFNFKPTLNKFLKVVWRS